MFDANEFGKAMAAIVKEATAPLLKRIEELEARQLEKGEQGDPGKDAEPIETADVVRELIACPEIAPILALHAAEAVAKHVEANPIRNGENGKDGLPGKDGEKGEPGFVGKDGAGIADLLIDRDGTLIATMTDGRMKSLGTVVGKDGNPGKDGIDLSDVSIDFDGHRTVTVKAKGGEIAKSYVLGIPLDAGYWRDGSEAQKGDVMTHAGNAWIAQRATKAKPCLENVDDWRMLARRGKDGVDGRPGRDLGPVPPIKLNGDGNA